MKHLFTRILFMLAVVAALGLLVLMLLGFAYLRMIVLSDDSLRQMVKDAVHDSLGRPRDDVEIEKFDVRFWDGRVNISNLKIKEKFDFQSAPSYFIQIPNLVCKLDVWTFLSTWKRELRNLDITIDSDTAGHVPEMILERSKSDGSLNIDDCLQKLACCQTGKMPLSKLNFVVAVNQGVVRFRDPFNNIGETSLENIALVLRMRGAGRPIEIEKCEMRVTAQPAPRELRHAFVVRDVGRGLVLGVTALGLALVWLGFALSGIFAGFANLATTFGAFGRNTFLAAGKTIAGANGFPVRGWHNMALAFFCRQ